MAAVSVAYDGTNISGAESETDGGTWDKWGATQSPSQEADVVYQGSFCISNKVSNTTGGIDFDATTPVNYSATARVAVAVVNVTTVGLIDTTVAKGAAYQVGSGGSAYHEYYIYGSQKDYPVKGGWQFLAIDPNVTAWRDATVGSPSLTAVDYYGWWADITASSKSENVMHDNLSYVDSGAGMTLTGGDGANADGVFQDFLDQDEGTSGNRRGLVIEVDGVLYAVCTLTVGSATATVFTDSNKTVVFPATLTDAGHEGLSWGLQSATNVHTVSSCSFLGRGQTNRKQFFDTTSSVNGGTEVITTEDAHGYVSGDAVLYGKEGGSAAIGLTDATEYFVNTITTTTLSLHTTRQTAISDTSRVNLTATGAESHSLTRQPDNRPTETTTGTSGSCTLSNTGYISWALMTLNSKHTRNGCNYVGCGPLDIGTGVAATLDGCNFSEAVLTEGNASSSLMASIICERPATISNCSFTFNEIGHAVLINDNTGSPFTYENNTHTGYWAPTDGGTNARGWEFQTSASGVNGTTEVITMDNSHGFSTGDAAWYNKHGGTAAVGLTDGARYYVNAISATTLSLHRSKNNANADTNRVNLTANGTDRHSLYSQNAAICNNSAGAITISVTGAGDTPSFRNIGGSTTTVSAAVTVTFEAVDKDDAAIQSVQVSAYAVDDDTEIILQDTNASGIATTSYTGTTPRDIYYRYRKASTGSTKYVNLSGFATIAAGTGVTVKRNMREDTIADPTI